MRLLPIFFLFAVLAITQQEGQAQYKNLPKAGFQTFSRTAGSELPTSSGVYLREGLNRSPKNMAEAYDPRHPELGFVRWEVKKLPLHIYISPGLMLPELPLDELKTTRVDMVREMLRESQPFAKLQQAPGWTPELNDIVAAGIEEWRQLESEGLVSFDFTDDPLLAHILIFFTDYFKDASSPGGINVGGNTCSQPIPVNKVRELEAQGVKIAQNPVIIELSTQINSTAGKLRGASAHEFGHALGIIEHSPYREDLMYIDRIVEELSPADKATFRSLYHSNPQGLF